MVCRTCRSTVICSTFAARDAVASFAAVRSAQSFHAVQSDADGMVTKMGAMPDQQLWINGGFFVLRSQVFDYIKKAKNWSSSRSAPD